MFEPDDWLAFEGEQQEPYGVPPRAVPVAPLPLEQVPIAQMEETIAPNPQFEALMQIPQIVGPSPLQRQTVDVMWLLRDAKAFAYNPDVPALWQTLMQLLQNENADLLRQTLHQLYISSVTHLERMRRMNESPLFVDSVMRNFIPQLRKMVFDMQSQQPDLTMQEEWNLNPELKAYLEMMDPAAREAFLRQRYSIFGIQPWVRPEFARDPLSKVDPLSRYAFQDTPGMCSLDAPIPALPGRDCNYASNFWAQHTFQQPNYGPRVNVPIVLNNSNLQYLYGWTKAAPGYRKLMDRLEKHPENYNRTQIYDVQGLPDDLALMYDQRNLPMSHQFVRDTINARRPGEDALLAQLAYARLLNYQLN